MNKMQTIHPWLVWRRKILMTMKLGVCFLLCTVFQVSARVTAQNERMNKICSYRWIWTISFKLY